MKESEGGMGARFCSSDQKTPGVSEALQARVSASHPFVVKAIAHRVDENHLGVLSTEEQLEHVAVHDIRKPRW